MLSPWCLKVRMSLHCNCFLHVSTYVFSENRSQKPHRKLSSLRLLVCQTWLELSNNPCSSGALCFAVVTGLWRSGKRQTQAHRQALNVHSLSSISLGQQATDPVPVVSRSDLSPTALSDHADSVRRCTVHCRELWSLEFNTVHFLQWCD